MSRSRTVGLFVLVTLLLAYVGATMEYWRPRSRHHRAAVLAKYRSLFR